MKLKRRKKWNERVKEGKEEKNNTKNNAENE